MTGQELIDKLRRLHTLLTIEKRSNNLAYAIRRGIDFIGTWKLPPEEMMRRSPIKVLFAGYGPKFIKIIHDLMETGTTPMLEEMQARNDPFFCDLCEIPSIGVVMARRMYFDRSIRTMNDLRIAYTNHILQRIPAFGEQRLKAVEEILWQSGRDDSASASQTSMRGGYIEREPDGTRSVSVMDYDVDDIISDEQDVFSNDELESALSHDACIDTLDRYQTSPGLTPVTDTRFTGTCSPVPRTERAGADRSEPDRSCSRDPRLEQAIETNSRCIFDADLSSEISRFVERGEAEPEKIEERGALSDPDEEKRDIRMPQCNAGLIQAGMIQAHTIYAGAVQARFIQAMTVSEGIRCSAVQGMPKDIQTEKLAADEIFANNIQAEYIQTDKIVCISCKAEFLMKLGRG